MVKFCFAFYIHNLALKILKLYDVFAHLLLLQVTYGSTTARLSMFFEFIQLSRVASPIPPANSLNIKELEQPAGKTRR